MGSNIPSWLIYSIACIILWGLWGVVFKIAYKSLSWIQIYFLSSIASFSVTIATYILYRENISFTNKASYIALSAGLLGGLGYLFFIKALENGKSSIVLPLTAMYPAITVILAIVFLGEKISIYQLIGIILALIAVIFLSIE